MQTIMPTPDDRAAMRKAVQLICAKHITMIEEVDAELRALLKSDDHKRTLVVASALPARKAHARASAYQRSRP